MTNEYKPLGASDNSPDWFYPEWAANAPNNQPIVVFLRMTRSFLKTEFGAYGRRETL